MQMDLTKVPKLVGDEPRERFKECYSILKNTRWPLYLIGPSGSGKTVTAMNLAKAYSEKNNVPAYYLQLSPDQTKTSIILGLRLVNGSLVPVKGLVSKAMEEGAIVVVDEATHTTQELLLMFNSIIDRTSLTSIGDEVVYAKDSFRIIFCSNNAYYAGNVRLPQSLAQRMVCFRFDYPSLEDEIKIVAKIVKDEYLSNIQVPASVPKYITSFVREIRNDSYPLSARNIAISIIRLAIIADKIPNSGALDDYFSKGSNVEAIRRKIAERIQGQITSSEDLRSPEVMSFMEFVTKVNINQFREIVLSACMYYLDVDGMEIGEASFKSKIQSNVI